MTARFVVFGLLEAEDLVSNESEDFDMALQYWDIMRCHGAYTHIRMWDNEQRKFIDDHVLELALKFNNS